VSQNNPVDQQRSKLSVGRELNGEERGERSVKTERVEGGRVKGLRDLATKREI